MSLGLQVPVPPPGPAAGSDSAGALTSPDAVDGALSVASLSRTDSDSRRAGRGFIANPWLAAASLGPEDLAIATRTGVFGLAADTGSAESGESESGLDSDCPADARPEDSRGPPSSAAGEETLGPVGAGPAGDRDGLRVGSAESASGSLAVQRGAGGMAGQLDSEYRERRRKRRRRRMVYCACSDGTVKAWLM